MCDTLQADSAHRRIPASHRRRELETSLCIIQEITMKSQYKDITGKGVNENCAVNLPVVSLGRTRHEQQVASDRNQATVCKTSKLRISTWNVNTLYQVGKLANVEKEIKRLAVDIMGVCEVRWTGVGSMTLADGGCFIYSGGDTHMHGVGIFMSNTVAKSLVAYYAVSKRVLMVRLRGKPFDICVIQVYAPTCDYEEEEVDEFYRDIMKAKEQCKPHDITIVMGDLNAKLGQGRVEDIIGPYGLGERNERGEKWAEWCIENEQVVVNTWFRQPLRRIWTWMSPGDRARNQIDYVTINRRFRNAVTRARTYPGADCNSDHVPVVIDIRVQLKKPKKRQIEPKIDIKALKQEHYRDLYNISVRNKYETLKDQAEGDSVEKSWENFREAIAESNREVLPKTKRIAKQPWMTEPILILMEDRRQCKGKNQQKYRDLNKTIHKECIRAKEKWIDEKCTDLEDLEKRDQQKMYGKIKDLVGKKKYNKNIAIKKADGKIAMDIEEVKSRWSEYVAELFFDERPESNEIIINNNEGPAILRQEVRSAIENMKTGKAVGGDGIAVEMLQALGDFAIDELTSLFNKIYETGDIVNSMCESIFIALPKVEGTLECNKHRTISIMSQITKIILRVILARIRSKIRPQISDEQFGFVPKKGTGNALFTLRVLAERALEVQKDLYVCFVDYEKAFDKVRHKDLFNILNELELDGKDLRLMKNLYWNQKASVRVADEESELRDIKRGVRQGCVLSPDLFNLYSEIIMRDLIDLDGIKFGGRNINNIRYADDTVLIADSEQKLQNLVQTLVQSSEERGLKLNISKTKVMVMSKVNGNTTTNIVVAGERLEQVERFKYLGSVMTQEVRCEEEIKTRVAIAKNAFNKIKTIATNRSISISLRKRFIKTYVWSTLLYGCEAWTISKNMERKIEATEMWLLRRMLRISWTERISNERVLHQAGAKREIVKTIRERQLRFLGHVMRRQQMENICMVGKVEGRRGRGRPRVKFLDSLAKSIDGGHTPVQLLQMTEERSDWRFVVANVQEDTALR